MLRKKNLVLLLVAAWLPTIYCDGEKEEVGIVAQLPKIFIGGAVGAAGAFIGTIVTKKVFGEVVHCLEKNIWGQKSLNKITLDNCTSLLNVALKAKKSKEKNCYEITIERYRKDFEKLPSLKSEKHGGILLDHIEKLSHIRKDLSQWIRKNYLIMMETEKKTNPIPFRKFVAQYAKQARGNNDNDQNDATENKS